MKQFQKTMALFCCFFIHSISTSGFSIDNIGDHSGRPKIEMKGFNLNSLRSSNEKLASMPFRVKSRLSLEPNSNSWDTITKNEYAYYSGTQLSENVFLQNLGMTYVPYFRSKFYYDTQGRMIITESQDWDGANWTDNAKYIQNFNSNGDITEKLYLVLNGANWDTTFGLKYIYTYNSSNQITNLTQQLHSPSGWTDVYDNFYTLNSLGETIEYIGKYWDPFTNLWINDVRYYNITWYNFSQFKVSSMTTQTNILNQFEDQYKFTFTYNSIGDLETEFIQVPNSTIWQNRYLTTFSYTNNLLSEVLLREWNAGWINQNKDLLTWDQYGNFLSWEYHVFNNNNWNLTLGQRSSYTYDTDNNIMTDIQEEYNYSTQSWDHFIQFIYQYDLVSSIPEKEKENLIIYPNPANSSITLRYPENFNKGAVRIYSTDRRLVYVYEIKDTEKTTFSIDELPAGVYLINISNDHSLISSKFIKQ